MSVVRRGDRRAARILHSSPYTRPAPPKKSSWSLSGFLSYILPIRPRSHHPDPAEISEEPPELQTSPAPTPSAPGHHLVQNLNFENFVSTPQVSATPQDTSQFPSSNVPTTPLNDTLHPPQDIVTPSPSRNLETVAAFLAQKAGQPLNQIEAAGLVALINQSTDHDDNREPFRFSSSPPSPTRGTSPQNYFSTPDVSKISNSPSPRKTLTKNPNGPYIWSGCGSARPRNRYHSPAFGSVPSTPKIKLSTLEPVKNETKRRRVGDDASNVQTPAVPVTPPERSGAPSPPIRPSATPAFPFPTINGTSSPSNGTPVNGHSLRIRTTGFSAKPTAPANPSPLRQSWGQSESPPAAKTTKAADFMTELIKEVTPPRKPDVSNPYQTASPVKPPAKKMAKRTRATGKPPPPPPVLKEPVPEPTPQAIIEATVPKGSKRSRPPPMLEKRSLSESTSDTSTLPDSKHLIPDGPKINGNSGSPEPGRSPSPFVVDAVVREPPVKKQKTALPVIKGAFDASSVTVEEIDDVNMPLASAPIRPSQVIESFDRPEPKITQPSVPPQNVAGPSQSSNRSGFGTTKSSAPKEPSKLRFSYQPDLSGGAAAPVQTSHAAEVVHDPREAALAMAVDALPSYTFTPSTSSTFISFVHITERNAAKTTPVSSLPSFDFLVAPASKKADAPVVFDWAAAGKKSPAATEGSWECAVCMLSNPGTALDKCTVCEAPRPGREMKAPPAAAGFDWAAVGMKPPTTSGASWTCSTCMLSNPATALDKCTVCETPR